MSNETMKDGERAAFDKWMLSPKKDGKSMFDAFHEGVKYAFANSSHDPVAWFTDDHLTDKSATTWDRNVAERWQAKGWPVKALYTRAASPQSGEPVKPEAKLVTFDEFVQYGIDHGANVVNGMPWSFIFNGHAVTHENDDLYLIGTPSIPFRRGEVLVATAFDHSRLIQVLQPQAPTERMSDAEDERAAFETWASQYSKFPENYDAIPAWLVWQAARRR